MCGGTSDSSPALKTGAGLSPRVRGNPPVPMPVRMQQRSIPACAGEPFAGYAARWMREVYPRVCGGTHHSHCTPSPSAGLSPRVRGNRKYLAGPYLRERSIPACAGEPDRSNACSRRVPVYPRVCGGTTPVNAEIAAMLGLSPRVRGNRWRRCRRCGLKGSIPACAGEPYNYKHL